MRYGTGTGTVRYCGTGTGWYVGTVQYWYSMVPVWHGTVRSPYRTRYRYCTVRYLIQYGKVQYR